MSKALWWAVLILLLLGLPLLSYGTLSPCGILRKELKWQILEKIQGGQSGWKALGSVLSVNMVDGLVDAMCPIQCVRGYVRLKFSGESLIADTIAKQDVKATPSALRGWRVRTEKSPMDDVTNVYVSLDADEAIKGWLSEETPTLVLRCQKKKTEVYFDAHMQVDAKYSVYGSTGSVRIRFAQQKAETFHFPTSTDGQALFVMYPDPISFIKRILKHQTMMVEFTPFNRGPVTTTFNLSGLDSKIGQLREVCGW